MMEFMAVPMMQDCSSKVIPGDFKLDHYQPATPLDPRETP
jgi:hypothetical protein